MSWNNSWLQSLCLECCNLFESLINLFQTYNCDSQTADSASTATALFSGIKTNINTLGFDCLIEYNDPTSELRANKVETILQWAQDAGMETGSDVKKSTTKMNRQIHTITYVMGKDCSAIWTLKCFITSVY